MKMTLVASPPYIAMQLSLYDFFKQRAAVASSDGRESVPVRLLCGAAAGLIAQTAVRALVAARVPLLAITCCHAARARARRRTRGTS
jgi:hypothetical protein